MKFNVAKYHALGNDFLVVESGPKRLSSSVLERLALSICNRRTGIGADGILYLSESEEADRRIDVYNADGSWAEKSGNGLRIAAAHLGENTGRRRNFTFEIGGSISDVALLGATPEGIMSKADLGVPDFHAAAVPVKVDTEYLINGTISIGKQKVICTCLSVGNPHCVVPVEDLEFDWQDLGRKIETATIFPRAINVEFVQYINEKKIFVAEWERGAGATGSSGTGAAAAVCASVMNGVVDRRCEVQFEPGSLFVYWDPDDNHVSVTGPVTFVMSGSYTFT